MGLGHGGCQEGARHWEEAALYPNGPGSRCTLKLGGAAGLGAGGGPGLQSPPLPGKQLLPRCLVPGMSIVPVS